MLRCNTGTYGYNNVCYTATSCPTGYVGDDSTNTCVQTCPLNPRTFIDDLTKTCVSVCPKSVTITTTIYYYADRQTGKCTLTCTAASALPTIDTYGNNSTQTCEANCIDIGSYADVVGIMRYCISLCTNIVSTSIPPVITYYYRNNQTKQCVLSTGCPYDNVKDLYQFGDNSTLYCQAACPIINSVQSWGYRPTRTCVAMCYA